MIEEKYKKEIDSIIEYSALGYNRNLVTAQGGNVSVRCEDGILITASGCSLGNVKYEDILLVDMDGNILDNPGNRKPSKESGFHLAIYKEDPNVNAVYHVHPPFITAFTVADLEFPRVTSSAKYKLGEIGMIEPMRAGSRELVEEVRRCVISNDNKLEAIILRLHGVITFAPDIAGAFYTAELMEDCARIAYYASQLKKH